MEESYITLAEAVHATLEHGGEKLLDSPNRLLALLADMVDPDCDEIRVLKRTCDEGFLGLYREAIDGTMGLDAAEVHARSYLLDECKIEPMTASAIASGFAEGVASFQGVAYQSQAQPQKRPQQLTQAEIGWSQSPLSEYGMSPIVTPVNSTSSVPRVELGELELISRVDYSRPNGGNIDSPEFEPEAIVEAAGVGEYFGPESNTFRIPSPELQEPIRGRDVYVDLEITEAEARDGVLKRVEYDLPSTGMRESCDVRVPAGTVNLSLVMVSGMGDLNFGGGERGDLAVRVRVVAGGGRALPSLTRRAALMLAGGLGLAGVAILAARLFRGMGNGGQDTEAKTQGSSSAATLVAVSAGDDHTVGLLSDGTAMATGFNGGGRCDVSEWSDLVAISAGGWHTVGLRSDGTAVAVGRNGDGQRDVSGWCDLTSVSAGYRHTVGLLSDGTVVATGNNEYGQCDVTKWQDIVAVSAGGWHTVGLRSDGTAVAVGRNGDAQCDVSGWHDLVSVSAGTLYTVGLRSDGTAVALGNNDHGQCDVSGWRDIVAVSAGSSDTVGLLSDGTAVATKDDGYTRHDVSGWHDLSSVSAGQSHTVGLCSDGTVVATGNNEYGQCDASSW